MTGIGPPLETLLRHLAECPAEFLSESRVEGTGTVHTAAVASDLLVELGGAGLTASTAQPFLPTGALKSELNRLTVIQVACWLLFHEWFRRQAGLAGRAERFLAEETRAIAGEVRPERLVEDGDRREELVRLALKSLDLRPEGESEAQAEDRLTTISSVERRRVILETRRAQARARELRAAMAKKAAAAAAAKATRE